MLTKSLKNARARHLRDCTRICFPHVPKCAGSALTSAIRQSYPLALRALADSVRIDLRASRRAADATSTPMHLLRENVLAYHMANPNCYFASGHVACRPSVSEAFAGDWHFITVLRDPVERWISNFVYDRYKASDWARIDVSAEEYVESDAGRLNGMVYLSYFSSLHSPPDHDGVETLVSEAESNLRRFAVVGCSERIDAAARDFEKRFGQSLAVTRSNSSPDPTAKAEIVNNPQLLAKIRAVCEPDQMLYDRFFSPTKSS